MFEHERTVYATNLGLLHGLVDDLTAGQMLQQVTPTTNPPVWILGHIAVSADNAGAMLGLERALPASWHEQFGMGSKPMPTLSPMPTKEELVRAIEAAHARVTEGTLRATAEAMSRPHGLAFLDSSALKTVGEVVTLLMTMHEGFHLGQLSYARRQMGYAAMF